MGLVRYFVSLKKRDLSNEQSEAGHDIKKERMMIFFWED